MKRSLFGSLGLVLLLSCSAFAQNVQISEFMANNDRTLADEDGEFPDWIEIYNADSVAVNLTGWALTDSPQAPGKWIFPTVNLPSGGFLVVFASGKNRTADPAKLHTSFQLAADGGYLALVKPGGTTIASAYVYPAVPEDVAYGTAQSLTTMSFLANSVPQILVPTNASQLPPDWNHPAYAPGALWSNGVAPVSIGFDTNQPAGAPVNVAPGGSAVQSTTSGGFTPNLAINGNLGDFTHTTAADPAPFWQLTFTNELAIHSVTLHNRTSCCGSRLRDIVIEILSTNSLGDITNYRSALLNVENTGFVYPNGPASLTVNLVALTGAPVLGQKVRVSRTPDPDLSGSGGQGNADEGAVLSLGEVVVMGKTGSDYAPYIRNDLQNVMLGRNASAFVRLPFDFTNAWDALRLRVRYDDGFVAYFNGTEVARRNAPGGVAWDSAATTDRLATNALVPDEIDLTSNVSLLANGANLLAIQGLNSSIANGDFLLQPELVGLRVAVISNVFLVNATPGAINNTASYLDEVSDTQFSVDRGFFESPFSLTITSTTPDAVIYYTFNSDEPGPGKGIVYTGPIAITNTAVVRARAFKDGWKASDVDTHTYIFIADVLQQAKDWPITRQPPPYFPASWGRNTVDYGMDPQIVTNYSASEWKEAFTQIPTMSIVTEMPNLFNPITGIYANADGHGEIWERPMSLELIDPTNAVPSRFQENCGLRIRGGFSRNANFVKHSFRVFFRREYGAGRLNYPLFDEEGAQEFETFDLRTSQNYSWPRETSFANGSYDTMVREVFCRETLGAMGQPYRRSRYYHLYVNGHYWGLYETDERPEASYGETYLGGQKENFDVVKCGNRGTTPNFATEATDGNLIAFSNLWTMTRSMVTNASNSNYFRILGRNADGTRNPSLPVMIEVDNLIDYMLGIFFTGDGDATLSAFLANNMPNNWFGMRDRANPDAGFRFFNSDCEHTLGSPSSQVDRTGPFPGSNQSNFTFANPQWMHEELMLNPEYRLRFADHVQKHMFNGGALAFESCTNRFLRKAAQITKAVRAYSARWGDAVREPPYNESDWQAAIQWVIVNWFPPRGNIVLGQLRNDGLFPTVGAPIFSQFGGDVPPGFNLELAHTNAGGAVFFTTDGSDPRVVGGGVSPSAQSYSSPIVINSPTLVRARILSNGVWSPIVEFFFHPPQDFSKLLMTEIMYHPPAVGLVDGDEYEFVEFKNAGTSTLNLSGLRFTAGITYTFPGGTLLAPGQFYVLVRNAVRFAEKYPGVTYHGVYSGRLDNAGETLNLAHPLGARVLSVTYDDLAPWPVTPDDFGFSLVPVNPNANPDADNPVNWRASTLPGGSPGTDDPASAIAPLVINEVLSHSETGVDFIEVFNPTANAVDLSGWFLTDDPGGPTKFRIPDGTGIAPLSYVVFDETDFNPTPGTNASFSLNAVGDDVYLFSGDANTNLTGYSHGFTFGAAPDTGTFGRYVISTGEEQFPLQTAATSAEANAGPQIGPVVINEIHYHPDTSGDEFIELKNISSVPVPLFDPAHTTNTWRLNGVDYSFPQGVTLGAGEKVLLVALDPGVFRITHSIPGNIAIFGPWAGNLQDSGERLELQRPDVPTTNGIAFITVDEVRYNDRAPWPIAADGSGPSLQRKTSSAYGNDPANWEAAIATPGQEFVGGGGPAIVSHPQTQAALAGQSASFTVVATGSGLNYQWRFNGSDISGATSSTFTLNQVQPPDAGNYSVVVFNASGSAASAIAILTVRRPPLIVIQPANQFVKLTSNAVFSVTASGNGFLRYQWLFNGTNIPNATNATLTVANAQFANEGSYSVIVADSVAPITSATAILDILIEPVITLSPVGQTVPLGGSVTLSVAVTNNATLPIGYRWRRGGATIVSNSLDRYTDFITISNIPNTTNFTVAVYNVAKPAGNLSAIATVTVLTDTDADGIPDAWENAYGLDANSSTNRNADVDGDTMTNWEEYVAGTNPTNALSYLRVDIGGGTLEFHAVSNKTYTVQYHTNLSETVWPRLADVLAHSTNRTVTISDPRGTANRYYRLATPQQP